MTFLILGLLIGSWIPYAITTLLPVYDPLRDPVWFKVTDALDGYSIVFCGIYSFMNVFVYGWCHKDYRAAFKKLLHFGQGNFAIGTEITSSSG